MGVGLRKMWLRSAAACVATSFEEIIGSVSVAGGNSAVSENLSLAVLGVYDVGKQ